MRSAPESVRSRQLIVIDPDLIDESNLHRQPLYRMSDVGQRKAEVARATLSSLNPYVDIEVVRGGLTPANAPPLLY